MTSALLLALLLAGTPSKTRAPSTASGKYDLAKREFNRGDFGSALKLLEQAAAEAAEPAMLSRVHLLRGQIFGAQQDFGQSEEAFGQALEHDPEAQLDPSKVDPALVRMLESLRGRLTGTLVVSADRLSRVLLDGRVVGETPFRQAVSIGRHELELRSIEGRFAARKSVVVFGRKDNAVELKLDELPPEEAPREGKLRPIGDLRFALDPFQYIDGVGIELGGGVESQFYRASLHARVFPDFGLVPRGALFVPATEQLRAYLEAELPVFFLNWPAVGAGGSGGIEYVPSKWLGLFFELGARYFFLGPPGYDRSRLTAQAGVRMRLP